MRAGGCLCGAVRYECEGDPQFSLQCHCRDCQRASVAQADSGNEITRVFCGDCGTPIYVQVSTRPDIVGVRVCTFDDPGWFRPDANIFTKSAQPWDHLDSAVPRF